MTTTTHDTLGNAVTLADAASLGAVNDFIEGFLAYESRIVNLLPVAERDESPWVHASTAALHMFAESPDAAANARPFIDAARRSRLPVTEREARYVEAVAAWVDGDIPRAIALHEEQAREHPRDLASLKLGQYHLFNLGQSPGMLRLALEALPAASDVAWLHGMTAFAWEQCHWLPEAEAAARHALHLRDKEPWAQHAIAHVMITQGRIDEGRAFMQEASASWTDLNSFMLTHNWWHLALFALEQDDSATALRLYDERVWGVVKDYSQDQIGAVSLLARLEVAGVDVGERWQDVADHLQGRTQDQVQPFLDLQYLYGLARADRPGAATLGANIKAFAEQVRGPTREAWQRVAVPAARGLLAHAQGDWEGAIEGLSQALPHLVTIGGSHAQRDLFEQLHLDALVRARRWSAAQHLMQQRVNASPQSRRWHRQIQPVHEALGLELLSTLRLETL